MPLLSILALLVLGSEVACCPLHWTEHEGSCYWFSQSEKSWPEADKYCQLENSHLVVVNSLEEQVMPCPSRLFSGGFLVQGRGYHAVFFL